MMKPVTSKVKPVPERYHSVTPYLVVQGVPKLLDFMKQTFNSTELERVPRPDGTISHAEVRIGDSVVMMGEASAQSKPMPTMLYVYVEDVDAVYKRALKAGAKSVRELKDEFYGDRAGGVEDPMGNQWWIATHKEDVSPEELRRRMEAQKPA
jgi:PhnB protein